MNNSLIYKEIDGCPYYSNDGGKTFIKVTGSINASPEALKSLVPAHIQESEE